MQRFKNSAESLMNATNPRVDSESNKVKKVLEECYFIISDLKAKNKTLEDTLNQKNKIIDKLIQEKQDHITHLSQCENDNLKKQLQIESRRSEEMRQNFETVLDSYDRIIKKYQADLDKLKGFNKVLRV
jgi:uncharacterized protein YdcH (DUF465 family)